MNRPPELPPHAPIGVFDSGVGGLTVVHALRERLPFESILYLGDTARVPYGPKSPATVRRYTSEAAGFLLTRDVKLLVIACNTATARAADDVASRVPVPVVGVIEPGATEAVRRSRDGRIGVIGTQGTIESGIYERVIRERRPS
jgi:glutamate racemase